MIVARLEGGLGNQLFQYAYGYALAQRHQTQLRLDLRCYDADPQHGYLLDRFRISASVATEAQLRRLPHRYLDSADQLPWPARWLRRGVLRRHKESPFGFHPRHLRVGDHRYLVGYWQSEKFFASAAEPLRKEFQLRRPLSTAGRQLAAALRQPGSVALHVRRGDYLSSQSAAELYCHLELDYYRRCVWRWANTYRGIPSVFVFSNDIPWCRQNLKLPFPVQFVEPHVAATAEEDLILMSQAACCVVANSTFSWWAAWLNGRPDKVILAPDVWFRPGTLDARHILPEDWILMPTHPAHPSEYQLQAA